MEKAEMKIAPSMPTLSIAATISSPVTWAGQFGTLCQGRFGVFASYAWTWESMIVIEVPHAKRVRYRNRSRRPCPGPLKLFWPVTGQCPPHPERRQNQASLQVYLVR